MLIIFRSASEHSNGFKDNLINSFATTLLSNANEVLNLFVFSYLIYEVISFAVLTTNSFARMLKFIDFMNTQKK